MILRKEQIEVLGRLAVESFEKGLIKELGEALPKVREIMGEERFAAKVRRGLESGREHGLESEDGLRLFTRLTFLLGAAFDKDPQTAWAGEILANRDVAEAGRVGRLQEKAAKHLKDVQGEGGEIIGRVLARFPSEPLEGYSQAGLGDFEAYMLRRYQLLYPEKCLIAGENCLRQVIRSGMSAARSRGLTTERGVTLYLFLIFLLGMAFDEDSQYPFAQEVLNDPSLSEPRKKAEILYGRTLEYLKRRSG